MSTCEKCGRELADGEICTCDSKEKPKKENNLKKKLILILAGILALLCIIGGIVLFIKLTSTSKKPINNIASVFNSRTVKSTELEKELFPSFISNYLSSSKKIILSGSSDKLDKFEADLNQLMTKHYDKLSLDYGEGWKIKFRFGDSEELDSETLEMLTKSYEEYYEDEMSVTYEKIKNFDKYDHEDIANSLEISKKNAKKLCSNTLTLLEKMRNPKITAGYAYIGRFVITDSKGKSLYESSNLTIQTIKLNGSWCIDFISLMEELKDKEPALHNALSSDFNWFINELSNFY